MEKRYFIKQKLMGALLVIFMLLTVVLSDGDLTAAIIFVPIGLYALFTKKMVMVDKYFFEVGADKEDGYDE